MKVLIANAEMVCGFMALTQRRKKPFALTDLSGFCEGYGFSMGKYKKQQGG